MTKKTMICIDNSKGYRDTLTVGKAYEVTDDGQYYEFRNDNGAHSSAFKHRFAAPPASSKAVPANRFIISGYSVRPASNGGFILYRDEKDPGRITDTAAFSNATDMLLWLSEAHGVTA